jgi:S-adenosylmethionine hydrolase
VLRTSILYIDSFGNVRLAGEPADLVQALGDLEEGRRLSIEVASTNGGESTTLNATWERTFGRTPEGATLLYQDSFGQLSLADNQGDLAGRLGLAADQHAVVRSA